jgi:hypothetical protein
MLLLQLGFLIGQMNRQPQGGGGAAGAGMSLLCCGLEFVLIAALVLVQILFLLNLSRCLDQCSRRNRTMEPGMVWLNLIPLFNIVWIFITVIRLSESLQNEYRSRGLHSDDPEFGKMMGILYGAFSVVGCFPVNLIFWIIYWMKISAYKNQLMTSGRGGPEDDFDDSPRRGRRDEDDENDERRDDDRRRRDDDH